MSVVAVKVNKHDIEIASDSIVVRGESKRIDRGFHKLEKINDIIVGAVGSAEEASLFMLFCQTHSMAVGDKKEVMMFMCEFLNWQLGFNDHTEINNEYIIIVNGKAFSVDHLFVEEITNYDAIGAGEDFATAALYLGHSAEEAVKVACDLCCFVSEPVISYKVTRQ